MLPNTNEYLLELEAAKFLNNCLISTTEYGQEINVREAGPGIVELNSSAKFSVRYQAEGCIFATLDAYQPAEIAVPGASWTSVETSTEAPDSAERCICGELLPCEHLDVRETSKVVR